MVCEQMHTDTLRKRQRILLSCLPIGSHHQHWRRDLSCFETTEERERERDGEDKANDDEGGQNMRIIIISIIIWLLYCLVNGCWV